MLHVYFPMMAFVTLFLVVGAIMAMLKWGPRICKTRHNALPDQADWRQKAYEQNIGFESLA